MHTKSMNQSKLSWREWRENECIKGKIGLGFTFDLMKKWYKSFKSFMYSCSTENVNQSLYRTWQKPLLLWAAWDLFNTQLNTIATM